MNLENFVKPDDLASSLPLLARLAVEHKVSITVTLNSDGCELRTEPWAPLQYVCPCGKGENA